VVFYCTADFDCEKVSPWFGHHLNIDWQAIVRGAPHGGRRSARQIPRHSVTEAAKICFTQGFAMLERGLCVYGAKNGVILIEESL
jgi:hypothetical protein